jgi:molecular chaperone DnaJ
VHVNESLPFTKAMLGCKITVDTIDGKSELIVPPCTQNSSALRMVRKGVPDVRTGMRGDQVVHITVQAPKSLTDRQRELLQRFEEEEQVKKGGGGGSSSGDSSSSGSSGGSSSSGDSSSGKGYKSWFGS